MQLFCEINLVTRCFPPLLKPMSRILTPKEADKPGQTRPISLADDTISFLTTQISKQFVNAIEKAGILGDVIYSYRKGIGTSENTVEQRFMIEDALESGQILGIIKEDKEKFFDRAGYEVQMMTLKMAGCPDQGYMEFCMAN